MASQLAILDSKLRQVQLPCLCSTRIRISARSIAMVAPQPPLQPLSSSSAAGRRLWNLPTTTRRQNIGVKSHLPLVSPHDQLGNLAVLFSLGALGIWSEETKIGGALSGALVTTLLGLAASNLGIIASDASSFPIVMDFLLPLAVPLLLFRADLHRVLKPTRTLLAAFFLGSVGTIIGTLAAYFLVPMQSLARDIWKIYATIPLKNKKIAPMGMYIGRGAVVKYLDIFNVYDVSSSIFAMGFVANNVIRAVYFATLCALASRIPPETTTVNKATGMDEETEYNNKVSALKFVTSLAVSFSICEVGYYLSKYFGIQGGSLPAITVVSVVLATIFSKPFAWLAPSGEAMAMILMQVFFAVMGARANIWSAVKTAPCILMFALVQISVHLAITIGLGKLLRFDLKSLLIASNAIVSDASTTCVIATTKGWSSMIIPGILAGIFGIPIGTFLGTWLAMIFTKHS